MKQAIALLLALIICIFLCACGSKNEVDTPEIEDNIEIGKETVAAAENAYVNHPHLQYLYGEWAINSGYENDDVAFRSLIVNEDGTCIADGMSATWRISEMSTESRLRIDIYSGSEMICSTDYNAKYDNIGGYKADGRACIGSYTNLSRDKVIE